MPKRPRLKPKSDSPLIAPAISSLVLILPDQDNLAGVGVPTRTNYGRNVSAIATAADIADVPTFVLSRGPPKSGYPLPEQLPRPSPGRLFTATGPHTSLWQNKAFLHALDREDRAAVVLAGVWLEYDVLTSALHALTDGYAVYVALDATPARNRTAAHLCLERLLQFGATPVLASQVINEWRMESTDASKRLGLSKLLDTLVAP